MKYNAIITDLDGTLTTSTGEDFPFCIPASEWINNDKAVRRAFRNAKLRRDLFWLFNMNLLDCDVIILTGRSDRYYDETVYWIQSKSIVYNQLFMREDGDYRPGEIFKTEVLKRLMKQYKIRFVFEDRAKDAEAIRQLGLTVFQVH